VVIRVVVDLNVPPWLMAMQPTGSASVAHPQNMMQQHGGLTPSRSPMEEQPVQEVVGSAFVVTSAESITHDVVTSTTNALPTIVAKPEPTLVELYEELLAKKERLRNEPKQVRDDLRYIAEFERWLAEPESAPRINTPRGALVKTLEFSEVFEQWARSIRAREVGGSVGQTMKKMNAVSKLAKACHAAGLINRAGRTPTQGDLRLMAEISASEDSESEDFQGEPVTVEEFLRMIDCCVEDAWPYLPKYWVLKLTASYFLGFRLQDWFAELETTKKGLLWDGVISDPTCPRIEGLQNEAGWLWYLVHKTKKKDQKKGRNPRVLMPNAKQLQEMMEPYRGLDPERVFPVPCNKRSSGREFHAILKRAGLDDATRLKQGKPIIRLSEGQKNIASFRKGCADMWADAVGMEAASYVLKHSVPTGPNSMVSATTLEHYLKIYRPLKEIVPAVESLPIW
jgi:hypothetical protein